MTDADIRFQPNLMDPDRDTPVYHGTVLLGYVRDDYPQDKPRVRALGNDPDVLAFLTAWFAAYTAAKEHERRQRRAAYELSFQEQEHQTRNAARAAIGLSPIALETTQQQETDDLKSRLAALNTRLVRARG